MLRVAHWISAPRHPLVAAATGGRGFALVQYPRVTSCQTSAFTPTLNSHYERRWSGSRVYSTSPESSSSGRYSSRYVLTLHPEKLRSAGQQILILSGQRSVSLRANDRLADSLSSPAKPRMQVVFKHHGDAFPPHSHGVFYYHSTSAQIRFRLCKTLEEFDAGSDLKLPDTRSWHLSLAVMARNPSRYGALLALVKAEFPVAPRDVDPKRDNHRLVSTFSPQMLVTTNQRIFDASRLSKMRIQPGGRASSIIRYMASHYQGVFQDHPFPDNTTGVFYYRQSDTSPTRVGELRFRLCADLQAFNTGSDLLLKSGEPWFISSQSLHINHGLKSVREHLVEEGLLEHDLYPGIPDSMLSLGHVSLISLGQPFVVDLSATRLRLKLINPTLQVASAEIDMFWVFRKGAVSKPLFSGRAVVCLEQYPTPDLPHRRRQRPVFALRVLELLTPLQRLSSDNGILDPTPGQLLVHRYRDKSTSEYMPWGYSPHKGATRAAITGWIGAQSNLHLRTHSESESERS